MSAQSRFRVMVLAAAIVAAAAVACGDPYLATNPYDPVTPVQFTITGPESLFSLGEAAEFSVQTTPAFPDTAFVWSTDTFYDNQKFLGQDTTTPIADGRLFLASQGAGAYRSLAPPLEPDAFNIAITVSVGNIDTTEAQCLGEVNGFSNCFRVQFKAPRHIAYRNVVVMQRVTRIQLRCPDTHACAPLAVGDSASVWVDGFDALGNAIVALTSSTANPPLGDPQVTQGASDHRVVTYTSRDSTVARATPVGIRVCGVTALKTGTTWIVATRGALADSLQVVVH
jgi:hypothetical protein